MRVRQPTLQADSKTLLALWADNMSVTAKQIQQTFNVCPATAFKVVNFIYQYAEENGRKIYTPPTRKLVPTDLLFERYGWDVEKVKVRVKSKGAKNV